MRSAAWLGSLCVAIATAAGCDRNIEPFDPAEEPSEPDLSKIFPEGAERAEQQPAGLPPAPGAGRGAPPLAAEAGAGADAAPVAGRVELSAELTGRVPRPAVLFIIARRGGGGPPLAVLRVPDPNFPLTFSLGPEDRMIQAMPFEGPLTLSARLDSDGDASSTTPGDLLGTAPAGPVAPGATGVVILLDTVL